MAARAPALLGTRSRTTTVPAARSPNRLPRLLAREQKTAGMPSSSQISTTSIRARTKACRNRIGASVVPDGAQAQGVLARGLAPGQGLEGERVADDHRDGHDQRRPLPPAASSSERLPMRQQEHQPEQQQRAGWSCRA